MRTQYVEGIYDNHVTLKSRLNVSRSLKVTGNGTIGYIIHDLVELFDVEYYRDLEMWDRGLTRSLKIVPFESFCTVSYSLP